MNMLLHCWIGRPRVLVDNKRMGRLV